MEDSETGDAGAGGSGAGGAGAAGSVPGGSGVGGSGATEQDLVMEGVWSAQGLVRPELMEEDAAVQPQDVSVTGKERGEMA